MSITIISDKSEYSENDWRTEEDVRTTVKFYELQKDDVRMSKVSKALRESMRTNKEVTKAISSRGSKYGRHNNPATIKNL